MEEKTIVSLQDKDVRYKIRSLWLEGKQVKEIQEILNIPKGTWDVYYYENRNLFRDYILDVKKQYIISTAEKFSSELMNKTSDNVRLQAIQQKEAEFLRETQGKDLGYSKRIETIGLNLNKTEPLDEEQKKKLDKLFKKTSGLTKDVEYVQVDEIPSDNDIDNKSNVL